MSEEEAKDTPVKDEIPMELRDFLGQFHTKPLTPHEEENMKNELGNGKLIVAGGLGLFVVCSLSYP